MRTLPRARKRGPASAEAVSMDRPCANASAMIPLDTCVRTWEISSLEKPCEVHQRASLA